MIFEPYDLSHARNYLEASIIRLAGAPIYIMNVSSRGRKYILHYTATDDLYVDRYIRQVALDDEDIDLSPITLGYVNSELSTVYLARSPKRAWKVGLVQGSLKCWWMKYDEGLGTEIAWKKQFVDAVKNIYPSIDEAAKKVLELRSGYGHAFHKRFSIVHAPHKIANVHYKWFPDAVGTFEGTNVVLKDNWSFLKETLEEANIPCQLMQQ